LTLIQFKKTPARRPQVEQTNERRWIWIHEKADTDIARAANKLWKEEFCWKDIPKLRFRAFRPKSARSYAEPMPRVQMGAEQDGLRWNCWKIKSYAHLEREGE
jgi:hypothetical protein